MFAKSLLQTLPTKLKILSMSATGTGSSAVAIPLHVQQIRLISSLVQRLQHYVQQQSGFGHAPSRQCVQQKSQLHTSAARNDLMEFFDDKKNWGERYVKVGRAWRIDELRIRSNTDLHKLWYVLLKERNMLMTMEHECKRQMELFPNPERLDKVEESMENIEAVVRERNRAYYYLETGTSGERPGEEIENFLGLKEYVQHNEYHVPKDENKEYLLAKEAEPKSSDEEKRWFLTRFQIQKRRQKRSALRQKQFMVLHTLRNFPDCDLEALKQQYPEVDVDRYVERVRTKHGENMVGETLRGIFFQPWRV